jgi:hypothetical protein
MGQIALWAAIVSFAGAALLLILSAIGLIHARWTPATTEILPKLTTPEKATVS